MLPRKYLKSDDWIYTPANARNKNIVVKEYLYFVVNAPFAAAYIVGHCYPYSHSLFSLKWTCSH